MNDYIITMSINVSADSKKEAKNIVAEYLQRIKAKDIKNEEVKELK